MRSGWLPVIVFFGLVLCLAATPAFASDLEERLLAVEAELIGKQASLDHVWTMTAAALVFLMQGGFLLLEAGMCRSKNSINVAQKNIADFVMAVALFYLIGFGFMFGAGNGWFGTSLWLINDAADWDYTFFVFQAVFCGTAATIVSGAVAERMSFHGYIIGAAIVAVVIYPVFGHWAWGNLLIGDNSAWLADMGFIDFAGSTVVHSAGGWVALAAIIVLGPRIGRFDEHGNSLPLHGHSAVLATFGAILLWVGWIGFNGGSTTAGTPDFARIVFNTMLAGAFGGVVAMVLGYRLDGLLRPDRSVNGILGGLVGITAGVDAVAPYGAVIIGISSGVLVVFSQDFIERRLKLDDVVGAVSVHGVCGAFGTIMAGVLAMEAKLVAASRFEQVMVQLLGVAVAFVWMFGIAYIAFRLIDRVWRLRVSQHDELVGLNTAEHGTTLGTGALQEALASLAEGEADLGRRLDTTTGDEAAELAAAFNKLMGKLQNIVTSVSQGASRLVTASLDLRGASSSLEAGTDAVATRAQGVDATTQAVSRIVGEVSGVLADLNEKSNSVRDDAVFMAEGVQTVGANIDEMSLAIREITESVQRAASIAGKAEQATGTASLRGEQLEQATLQIQDFLKTIRDLAQKSRMLALNASIEAERAGVAGQGFAVVASEVKAMAAQTERASNEAEIKLNEIQNSSRSLFEIMEEVSALISEVNQSSVTISGAVEEQSAVAEDIRRQTLVTGQSANKVAEAARLMADRAGSAVAKASEASGGTDVVAGEIGEVSKAVSQSRNDVGSVASSAGEVSKIAANLQAMIGVLAKPKPA